MTGLDLISSSLRLLGVLASGETPSANESNDALAVLNDMIDSWSTERLLIYTTTREVFPLVQGQQTYTIGPTGNFNTSRPQRVETALLQLNSNSPVLELPMKILNQAQYAAILLKTNTSTYPLYLYVDGAFPLNNISVYPVPTAANNIVLYSWKPLSEIASLTTVITLPPGYSRAMRYNLAIDLAPEFGKQLQPEMIEIAAQAKSGIKRMNSGPHYLQVDNALRGKSAVWNWMTGEPT